MRGKKFLVLCTSILTCASLLTLVSCDGGGLSSESSSSSEATSSSSSLVESSTVASSSENVSSESSKVESSSVVSSENISSSEESSGPIEHTINITASDGCYGDTNVEKAAYKDTVVLIVTVDAGYKLVSVKINGTIVTLESDNTFSFLMPNSNVSIVITAAIAYGVTFENSHVTGYIVNGGPTYIPTEIVSMSYKDVEAGYYFGGFEVTSKAGEAIEVSLDEQGIYSFIMPEGGVNDIKASANLIPEALVDIGGTYTKGIQLDSNVICDKFKLVINYDYTLEFHTDWQDPLFVGTYTFNGTTLVSELKHQGNSYHFEATLKDDKFLEIKFYLSPTSLDYYLFAKPEQELSVSKLYLTYLSTSGPANRLYQLQTATDTFFAYVPKAEDKCFYYLKAYDGENVVTSLEAGKIYSFKDKNNNEKLVVKYDGNNINLASKERGTYTCGGSEDLILDGFNHATLGTKEGTYAYVDSTKTVTLTFGEEVKTFTIDVENHTYVGEISGDTDAFVGQVFSGEIKAWTDEEYSDYSTYTCTLTFGSEVGSITSLTLKTDDWSQPISSQNYKNGTYTYDEATTTLSLKGCGSITSMTSNTACTKLTFKIFNPGCCADVNVTLTRK